VQVVLFLTISVTNRKFQESMSQTNTQSSRTINEPPGLPSTSGIVSYYEHLSSDDLSSFANKKLNDKENIKILQNVLVSDNNFNFPKK